MWVAQAAPRGERLHFGPPLTLYVEERALTHGLSPSLPHHNSTSHSTSGKEYTHSDHHQVCCTVRSLCLSAAVRMRPCLTVQD